jgi:hypothetical protein
VTIVSRSTASLYSKNISLCFIRNTSFDLTGGTVAKFIKRILNAVPAEDVVEVRYARGIGPLVIRK